MTSTAAADLAKVRRRMADRIFDLRDVGELLTGKWDQDFPAWLLAKADGPWLPASEDEALAYEAAMHQWERSLKRPDLSERDRVGGALAAFLRQLIACEIVRSTSLRHSDDRSAAASSAEPVPEPEAPA